MSVIAEFKSGGSNLRVCLNAVQPCYVKLFSEWRGGMGELCSITAKKKERCTARQMITL